jgi:hypothetical protein
MKRILGLLTIVLGSTLLLSAQDTGKGGMGQGAAMKGTEMTGMLCDSKCVKQDAAKASCDLSCTEKSGEATFIDDDGKATKVANPEVAAGKMGKKVKIHCDMMKDQAAMKIYDVVLANAG